MTNREARKMTKEERESVEKYIRKHSERIPFPDSEAKEKMMDELRMDLMKLDYIFLNSTEEEIDAICDHIIRKGWRKGEMK